MAKSKKALKALKRRKAAKGRSRVLKERQDYTKGGRVKAFTGFPGNISIPDQEEIKKRVDAYRKSLEEDAAGDIGENVATSDAGNTPGTGTPPTTGTPATTGAPATDTAPTGTPDTSEQEAAAQAERERLAAEAAAEEERKRLAAQAAAEAAAEEERRRLAAQAAARAKTGTVDQTAVDFTSSPFNYDSLNINADTEVRNIRVNDGTGNVIVPVPFGSLSTQQQNALKNIRSLYPDETERAREAYKYLNNQLGIKQTASAPDERETEEEAPPAEETPSTEDTAPTDDAPPAEAEPEPIPDIYKGSYEDFIGSPAPINPGGNFGRQARYIEELNAYNAEQTKWNNLTPEQRFEQFGGALAASESGRGDGEFPTTETGQRSLTYEIPGLSRPEAEVQKADVSQVGTGAETKAQTFQIDQYQRNPDGSLAFDAQGNVIPIDRSVAELTDEEKVGTTAITGDTVTTGERREVVPLNVKINAEQLGVEAPAIEAYTTAEANYFSKYPEVRDAINQGLATDIFDYQRRIGAEKGYTLDFDASEYADGTVDRLGQAFRAELQRTQAAQRDAQAEQAALAERPVFTQDLRSEIDRVTGERVTLSATPEAEKQQRQAITDETAATGTEAIIQGSIGYEAAERRQVKGEAAQGAAVSMLSQVGQLPTEISEAILDNPAQVTAQVDTEPVEVQAAIAALPNEALVSVQLENLLAGIDEGVTPSWARPAVQAVESRLNARGLSVSTVGRDSLFNAIIQTALPIAQSNAAALQQRANQNLSNEQQANLQQANQEMQVRLTNLANRQGAETQSAQLAQQINLTQGQFTQQAQMTEAEQRQQVRLQSLQNEQQAAMANLGNDQQIELANLQVEADRLGANQSATNQERLAEMQVAANFLQRNADFKQQMEVANLSNEQQMRLAFLTAKNQAEAQNLTAAQQTELANLNSRLEVNRLSASLAQQMNLAQLNVDQQRAVQNAATVANIDLTKFSAAQQIELTNSRFMQTSTLQDLNNRQQAIIRDATSLASMDLAAVDAQTKVSVENARNFLAMNMANLTNEQQAYMLDSQQRQQLLLSDISTQNAARQFNATSDLQTQQYTTSLAAQINQFNSQQINALEQFNATESNRVAAINAGNELQAEQFMAQIQTQIRQFNSQQDIQVEQFNVSNAQAVEQSNVEWRRKANLADTAATNAANQQQAAFQFDMNKTALSQAWQSLRDQANFDFQEYQSSQERKISAINAILSNEAFMTDKKYATQRTKFFTMLDTFSDTISDIRDLGLVELADELQEEA